MRLRFTMRRLMAAIAALAVLSGAILWALRREPTAIKSVRILPDGTREITVTGSDGIRTTSHKTTIPPPKSDQTGP